MNDVATPAVATHKHRPGRVARAFLNYGLGGYLPQIVNFLLVPMYTHYIAPAQMGILDVCLTAQVLLVTVMRLGMSGSVTRYYFDLKDSPEFRDFITTVAMTMLALSCVGVLIGFTAGPIIFQRWFPQIPFHPYMDISLATAFFQGVPDLQRRLHEAREQSSANAKLSVSMGVFTTTTNIVCVVGLGLGAVGVLWAGLASAIVFAVVMYINNREDLRGRFHLPSLRQALKYGLPLVPHHAAAWAQQFVGRWVLSGVATAAAVGHLGLATRLASPLTIATSAFASAYSPVYFSWRKELPAADSHREARRVSRVVLTLGAIAVAGAATLGGFLVRHVMNPSYRPASPVVGIVAAALFSHLVYTTIAVEFFFSKNTKWISTMFVLSATVNLVLVAIFAPRWGASAAAAAQLFGSLVSVAVASYMTSRTAKSPLSARVVTISLLTCTLACAVPRFLVPDRLWLDACVTIGAFLVLASLVLVGGDGVRELREGVLVFIRSRRRESRAAAEPSA
jgi:O-antigen/teichoic acid export membrane protein